jgi:hypothetical protein
MAAPLLTPTPPVTINGTSTAPTDTGQTSKISYGIVGFLIFLGVLLTVICMKKKCARNSRKRHSSSTSSHSSLASYKLPDVNSTGNDSQKTSACWLFSDDIKASMKEFIIESNKLILEKVIGKGTHFGSISNSLLYMCFL